MNVKQIGVLTIAVSMWAATVAVPVMAHENSLQKAGKAIQYTTRKDSENLTQDTHRAVHENSVHTNRTGENAHTKYVLTPAGNKYRIYHHHHYRHHLAKK